MKFKTFKSYCKIYYILLFWGFFFQINAQNHKEHGSGAKLLTEKEYDKLPKVNWDLISLKSNIYTKSLSVESGIVMLNNPPIGDQGYQLSCVGWAVGYAAIGILTYPIYNNWEIAKRSPGYLYNQIKINSSCLSPSYIIHGIDTAKAQGVCSWSLMPYIEQDCSPLPNAIQKADASIIKLLTGSTLNRNDVSGIKQALELGFPVVIAFKVYESFYDMWNYGSGIWNANNYGQYRTDHSACIVGFDDTKQMFKVQNSWGTNGGDNGYFWISSMSDQNKENNINTYEIQLWNNFSMIKRIIVKEKVVEFPLVGIPDGLYFIHVLKNGKTYKQQLKIGF